MQIPELCDYQVCINKATKLVMGAVKAPCQRWRHGWPSYYNSSVDNIETHTLRV